MALLAVLALFPAAGATAATDPPKTYSGHSYGDSLDRAPTRFEQQSKLWFHDGAWWALMLESSDSTVRIFELQADHTWRPTAAVINRNPAGVGDALSDGDVVYVISPTVGSGLAFDRLSYDERTREYTSTLDDQVTVINRRLPAASLAKDTTGQLWVAFTTRSEVLVVRSDTDGDTWTRPFAPAVPGTEFSGDEAAAVVAFDESIGVMWSDQTAEAYRFAVHQDGASDDDWSLETPLQGPRLIDNHLSVKVLGGEPADTVVAAVKTSFGDMGEAGDSPLVLVLARSPDGSWSNTVAGTVEDDHNRPVVQIDGSNRAVYVLVNASPYGGTIYYKRAPIGDLSFPPGRGVAFAYGTAALTDASGSKHPVSVQTGLVVLASGSDSSNYHHAEMAIEAEPGAPLPADDDDNEPPAPPEGLWVGAGRPGSVVMHWSPSTDGEDWTPGADVVAVRGYTVYRDGIEVGTTTQTYFADTPPAAGAMYEYSVTAFDHAGNDSMSSAAVSVTVPESPSLLTSPLGWSLLAGTATATLGALAVRRWWIFRT